MSDNDTDGRENFGSTVNRRSMLMALGTGSSLSLTGRFRDIGFQDGGDGNGGNGGGNGGNGGGGSKQRRCPPCIDPYSGYLLVEETKRQRPQPQNIKPSLTVEARVEDADIVFPEQGGGPADGGGTQTTQAGTTTETETGEAARATTQTQQTATGTATTVQGGEQGGNLEGFPDFFFDPVGVRLRPGDSVEFLVNQEFHTVTAYHPRFFGLQRRVPQGAPGFSSQVLFEGDSWYYRFDETGVYDVMCLPHEELGMVMRLVVVEEGTDDVPDAYPQPGPDEPGPSPIAQTVFNAPELDPKNVVEQGTVSWTDLTNVASEPPFEH